MSDHFRSAYRELTVGECRHVARVKAHAEEMYRLLGTYDPATDTVGTTREFSLARTKLEECVMWAVKAITG